MENEIFVGINMKDAVSKARANLGEAALIVSDRVVENGIEVVARKETEKKASADCVIEKSYVSPGAPEESFNILNIEKTRGISDILRWHRVPDALVDVFSSSDFETAIAKNIQFGSFSFSQAKRPLALVGTAGAGKSLSVAKLCSRLVLSGNPPLVITTDRERAGGIDQLATHTRRLGLPLIVANDQKTLRQAMAQRKNDQPVLIDTAPVDPYDENALAVLMELKLFTRAELCVVVPAGYDSEETADVAELFWNAGARMMIASRLDQVRRLGNIITAAACGLVMTEYGVSENCHGGLEKITPKKLAALLVEKTENYEKNR
ncbi:MAG: hypothetical protein ABF876_17105 [Acetobacter aceti]|uniref:flagellar biosynthesis protein FlhF n=1 Tax=Acetobacter aceti TaxID=435 RepID=UPI000989FAE1|nr:hypothetical protein [Acetobacter aceti]